MESAVHTLRDYIAAQRQQNRPLQLETIAGATGWTEAETFRALQMELQPARHAGTSPLSSRERPAHTPRALREENERGRAEPVTADMEARLKVLADAVGR